MHFTKRYLYLLIFVSMLFLTGSSSFSCTSGDNDSDDKKSSGGNTEIKVKVSKQQKISADSGGFNGSLDDGDQFGSAIADPGDLEADGVRDLAVGTPLLADPVGRVMSWDVLFVLGIPLGAFIAARRSGPVTTSKVSAASASKHFAGGLGLGVGASLAAGCTVGHGLTGVPLLAPGSLLAIVSIFAGSAITSLWTQRGMNRALVQGEPSA